MLDKHNKINLLSPEHNSGYRYNALFYIFNKKYLWIVFTYYNH